MHRCTFPVIVLGLLSFSSSAIADCAAPPPVVWSYPHDGATDVPTDIDLIVTGSTPSITFDGNVIERDFNQFVMDLGDLEPNTEYTIDVGENAGALEDPTPITVTTGNGAGPVEFPAVDEAICQQILQWQDCFDTGPPAEFHLNPSPRGAEQAYIVSRQDEDSSSPILLWPRSCGFYVRVRSYDTEPDFLVEAVDYDGSTRALELMDSPNEEDGMSACSVTRVVPGTQSWKVVFLLSAGALWLAWLRRSRRLERARLS